MMTIVDQIDEKDPEIVEKDIMIEIVHLREDDVEVGNENTVTGETILMKDLEDDTRTILTLYLAVEVTVM